MTYDIKYFNCFALFFIAAVFLGGCAPQSEVDNLKAELENLKNPKQENVNVTPNTPSTPSTPTIIYTPSPNTNNVSNAPVTPSYGPGNANNIMTPSNGYLSIQTNSANGKLCLRANASQGSTCLVEIPNGTSGLSYYNRVQVGDYVWYEVTYGSYTGYLRGDYIFI